MDCQLLWDVLKVEIREISIAYCKAKANRELSPELEK